MVNSMIFFALFQNLFLLIKRLSSSRGTTIDEDLAEGDLQCFFPSSVGALTMKIHEGRSCLGVNCQCLRSFWRLNCWICFVNPELVVLSLIFFSYKNNCVSLFFQKNPGIWTPTSLSSSLLPKSSLQAFAKTFLYN